MDPLLVFHTMTLDQAQRSVRPFSFSNYEAQANALLFVMREQVKHTMFDYCSDHELGPELVAFRKKGRDLEKEKEALIIVIWHQMVREIAEDARLYNQDTV